MIFFVDSAIMLLLVLVGAAVLEAYRGDSDAYYIQPSMQFASPRSAPVYSHHQQLVRNPPKVPQNVPHIPPYDDSPGAGDGPVPWKGQHQPFSAPTTISPSPTIASSVCRASTLVLTETIQKWKTSQCPAVSSAPCVSATLTLTTTKTVSFCVIQKLTVYEAFPGEEGSTAVLFTESVYYSCEAASSFPIVTSTTADSPCYTLVVVATSTRAVSCLFTNDLTIYGTHVTTDSEGDPSYAQGASMQPVYNDLRFFCVVLMD
ncbi:uncharacterized protein LOC129591483 isoform X1 [Paramacrobiotus metropolitanus]|uniref:uncharacterized protein LOC129591483 isoform X1 n=1 Tax=Paramacrobiotus metropolitanus TaxID=2943436 RepID=UPI0024460C46|nr:uncharacterized protein LOC129591483 isoform X1 [Paramacrobiotus metropolitanus]